MAGDFIQRSRHGTVIFFRRRVPKDLQQRLGRSQIYVSLGTQVLNEARGRARVLAAITDRLFAEARYMESNRSQDALFRTEYVVRFTPDADGRPFFEISDIKEGETRLRRFFAQPLNVALANRSGLRPRAPDRRRGGSENQRANDDDLAIFVRQQRVPNQCHF